MDNLSHAFVGIALAALSGHQPSLTDPLYIATVLGAQAPDFDIITHLKSNFAYMKSHRAFSHSLPGLMMWSGLITVLLYDLGMTDWLSSLLWSFVGGLSHIFLDYFNTHGASLLWPLNKKRQTNHLLNVFDPLLLMFFSIPYFFALPAGLLGIISLSTLACYLVLRIAMRIHIKKRLSLFFATEQIARLAVMPNLKRVLVWDFVVELADAYVVGQFDCIQCKPTVKIELLKQQHPEIAKLVQTTELGEFFQSFTPFLYFNVEKQANGLFLVKLYDLRYFLNEKFVHRAIIHFDKNQIPLESYLLTANHIIKIPT